MMKENNWTYNQGYDFVKSKRNIISPNSGFIQQLIRYEIKLGLKLPEELDEKIKNKKFVKELCIFQDDD